MIRKIIVPIVAILSFVGLYSCEEEIVIAKSNDTEHVKEKEPTISNPWINNPYKLNVIYFVPNDLDTIANYRQRVSNILLDMQEFYGQNMKRSGYSYTSFGLDLLSDTLVNIITIRGEYETNHYPSNVQGSFEMRKEISKYFVENPDRKTSDHLLVFAPTYSKNGIGGPPFQGETLAGFVLDYPGMDVDKFKDKSAKIRTDATYWIGGLAHELGHGLNAPHNKEHKTDAFSLGGALMRNGNATYGTKPCHITNATCALLSTCQVFSKNIRNDWYGDVSHVIKSIKGEYRDGEIIITGKYYSSKKVSVINVYHDPEGGEEYDALAWDTKPNEDNNSFSVRCPLKDFHKLEGKYNFRVVFWHENGTKKLHNSYNYEFDENGIPKIEMINTPEIMDRSDWRAIEVDSEDRQDKIGNILDNDMESFWHTEYWFKQKSLPHHFVVDMAKITTVNGFAFSDRKDLAGAAKDIEILISDEYKESKTRWKSIGKFKLIPQKSWQYIDLKKSQKMRYVKVLIKSTNKDQFFTHFSEFAAY